MILAAALDALDRDPKRLGRVSASFGRIVDSEGRVFSVTSDGRVLSVESEGRVDTDVIEGSEAMEVDAIVELCESEVAKPSPRPKPSPLFNCGMAAA